MVQDAADGDAPVYGVNTGFGKLANKRIDKDQLDTLQRNLIRSHSVGVGEPLAAPIMRLMMATKAASLARGYSGCREVVVDTILAVHNAGLVPCVPSQGSVGASGDLAPLSHMTLALMGEGGWTARSTAQAFQRYTKVVMERLGDRLDAVATFNEPWCSVWLSHLYGVHAPGERCMDAALHALHYTNLAHGLSVQAIREVAPNVQVGLVLNAHETLPGSDSAADKAAAERAHQFHNGVFFDPVFKGEYPAEFLSALGHRMPVIEEGDLVRVATDHAEYPGRRHAGCGCPRCAPSA